jgi:DNA repair protein RecO (recombination protein O)
VTVQAIVLRRRDSGESDRRLTILTPEFGKFDVLAKGARKSASRLAGSSDPLSVAVLSLAAGKRNRYITQAQPLSSFRGLRTDYERLTFALALCELYAAVLPVEQPLPEVYDLLLASLQHLETHPRPVVALVWAQVQLLQVSGFLPQFDRCVVTESEVLEALPFVSPTAGGYVVERAASMMDRYRTRAEVLYGLARLPMLEAPPNNMKFSEEAVRDLLPFWRHFADAPLPANESLVADLRHRLMQ